MGDAGGALRQQETAFLIRLLLTLKSVFRTTVFLNCSAWPAPPALLTLWLLAAARRGEAARESRKKATTGVRGAGAGADMVLDPACPKSVACSLALKGLPLAARGRDGLLCADISNKLFEDPARMSSKKLNPDKNLRPLWSGGKNGRRPECG